MKAFFQTMVVAVLFAFLAATPVFAQKKLRQHYKLPTNITSNDYQAGSLFIKLKPEHRYALQDVGSGNRVGGLFRDLNVTGLNRFASDKSIAEQRRKRGRSASVDLSLFYEVRFDPSIGVEEAINKIYDLGIVQYAEPNFNARRLDTPNDPELSRQNYLDIIKAFEAWDISKGSDTIVIAIVDSGADLDHPDLASSIFVNEDEVPDNGIDDDEDGFIDNVFGWDFAGDDFNNVVQDNNPQVTDEVDNSHGIRVAGCAGALANNEIGIAGSGYQAKIMALKHAADNDTRDNGGGFILNSTLGLLYAANNGAHIINASFGGGNSSRIVEEVVRFAVFDQNVLVISSAGNDNSDAPSFPSDYPGVLSVASSNDADEKAGFSNFGTEVDITAPGVAIFTTTFDDGYTTTQGTSFSAPIVAGAAAIVWSHYPDLTAFQVGEVLRTTADPGFYDNLASVFDNKMGLGRLDMERALTVQTPSVRLGNVQLLNAEGNIAQAGDQANLIADFTNFLWPSSSNLEVKISSESPFINIISPTSKLGIIDMNGTVNNSQAPLQVEIASSTPQNTEVSILFEFTDGAYTDYQWFTALINPTFLNLQENEVATTLSNFGRIGYQDDGLEQGVGFVFENANLLFEMGLMMATSENQIANAVRTDGASGPDEDFVSVGNINISAPGEVSSAQITGGFEDRGAGSSALGVSVDYRGLAWRTAPNDKFVIVEYTITNNSADDLLGFYAGLFADWDVNQENFQDFAEYDATNRLGYVYGAAEDGRLFAGIQELSGQPNYYAIENDHDIEGNPLGIYDDFTDTEKFTTLSSGLNKTTAGLDIPEGTDVSHVMASGPYNIASGESITIAFALHGANTLDEITASAQAAEILYNQTLQATLPEVSDVTVCYGAAATLTASGANSFNWYASIDGGEALTDGPTLVTEPLFNDTIFYVTNADESFESARKAVRVTLAANPEIIINGSASLCEGDQVVLTVADADTYLWSDGSTTQDIVVTDAGSYTVEVTDAALGCSSSSEAVVISSFPSPVAQFTASAIEIDEDDPIDFTDQSTNAVSWFWDFGDGNNSTEQNPTHTYTTGDSYEVTLIVTSADGCAATAVLTIEVVTGIPEELLLKGVTMFPNPTQNRLNVQVENNSTGTLRLAIYNTLGETVLTHSVEKVGLVSELSFSTATLPKGIYMVQVNLGNELNVLRLIKE